LYSIQPGGYENGGGGYNYGETMRVRPRDRPRLLSGQPSMIVGSIVDPDPSHIGRGGPVPSSLPPAPASASLRGVLGRLADRTRIEPRIVPGSVRVVDPDDDFAPDSFVAYASNTPVRR
jgi:hypothetical protein